MLDTFFFSADKTETIVARWLFHFNDKKEDMIQISLIYQPVKNNIISLATILSM